jgi:RNA polymerase sigma-70 factor (ECF subfamily)
LAAEALVEGWKSLARYDGSCRLSTWLGAILVHRHHKALRRLRSRPLSLAWLPFWEAQELHTRQENQPALEASPAESLVEEETARQLREGLEHLSEKHREVIALRFFQDTSLTEMAALLGCSEGTVKSRLHHALKHLRKMKMNLPESGGDKQGKQV